MENNTIAFVLLRLAVAASMFGHGLVRLPKLNGFSHWMTTSFEKSMLPGAMVLPFSYILPIAEFVVGLLLILGLFTRLSLIAGAIIMIMLILGTTLIEEWGSLPSQLIHVAFFAVLLVFIKYNGFALDRVINK
ncbi:DoxX family membrane protein [Chitinophaga sp. G-6-1-13]|uniref:DoxX family membrane protein n=1 Tax=Chitinophaga fulva TaxID=2728842 RepID=A0A848GFB7_9BACT|nr:DoxX family membrane protein [Chitinophaga fulva]NML35782.1 DoxX family membrane protein [Chitinophaga fulva]